MAFDDANYNKQTATSMSLDDLTDLIYILKPILALIKIYKDHKLSLKLDIYTHGLIFTSNDDVCEH